ncbi:MAG: CDP-alcohol phosphatidyltransferase family protein [Methylotetracoccus sp.]
MRPRDIPNLITGLRILLVAPVVFAILSERFEWALGLFIVAGASDGVDGFLAKYFSWQSRLGSLLDPIADKLLLVGCFIASWIVGLLPAWLVIAVVARDLVIVGGATAYHMLVGPFEGRPLLASKLNTLMQLVLLLVVLLDRTLFPLSPALIWTLSVATLATTLGSGLMYVYRWGRSYRHRRPRG